MKTFRLYLRSMKMLMKCQFEYPVSFFLQTLAQLIMEGGEMLAVILIINRFDRVNQWEAGDLFFFFGLMSVTFYLTECFGRGITGNFPYMIRSGQMDTVLLRPRGVLTQVLCSAVDPRRIACIAVGTTSLVIGCRMAQVRWTALKVLAMAEAVGFGAVLILALFLIEAVFCIYSVKSVELVNALSYGGRSACEYPIDIYPRPLRTCAATHSSESRSAFSRENSDKRRTSSSPGNGSRFGSIKSARQTHMARGDIPAQPVL